MDGGAVMRRPVLIVCIAAAAVVTGGTLWAIASSDMLGSFGLSSSTPASVSGSGPRSADKVAAVPATRAPVTTPARRSAEPVAVEIARIEAGGASVIAGRSPPNHRIVVLANGREIATTVATDEGQWSVIVTEGIAAGPLELSVSARPAEGGAAVASTPRQLVVPPSSSPSRLAEAAPAKAWTSKTAAGANAPEGKVAVAPAAGSKSQVQASADTQPESRFRAATDKQALERFAALVERARTDAAAAAAAKRDSPAAGLPATVPSPSGLGAATLAPTPMAPATAAATSLATRTDARPDPAQAPIPVPITFVTDETDLTPDGARAAALLAEYLRIKRPEGISLSGHADSRGPDGYNMELSRRRLEAIERYLRQAGYAGNLSLTPKGKREPYLGIDRTKVSQQEVYQADRRVELRLTQ